MSNDPVRPLLDYFQRELNYLRTSGIEFSKRYPKIAERLEAVAGRSNDPHVELMLQSFAFLTGRLQYNLDSNLPEIPRALLSQVYPQLDRQIPSMAIAQFDPGADNSSLSAGILIEKGSSLFSETHQGDMCRFMTGLDTVLWPLAVISADIVDRGQFDFLLGQRDTAAVIQLTLRATGKEKLSTLPVDRLRFYLHGGWEVSYPLYESIMDSTIGVVIKPEGGAPRFLSKDAVRAVGFEQNEGLIPYPDNAHPGYRLIQEYFAFPEKFLFFDIDGLAGDDGIIAGIPEEAETFTILLLIGRGRTDWPEVDRSTFCLNCTPIINLFARTTDPVRIDQTAYEYKLIPDQRLYRTTEVFSISEVRVSTGLGAPTSIVHPYFSFAHLPGQEEPSLFWSARRVPSLSPTLPGSEMFISFHDSRFQLVNPPRESLQAVTLCSNRDLARQIPPGGMLALDGTAPIKRIHLLDRPTPQRDIFPQGEAMWRLVSSLNLNRLSLGDDEVNLEALKEILKLYASAGDVAEHRQIDGITAMTTGPVVRRIGDDAWRGFCRGTRIRLVFDENNFVGASAYLMAAVLNHFFSLYASVNSFTELTIASRQRKGEWTSWLPRVGDRPVL